MSLHLSKGSMQERSRDLSRTNLLFIFGIIKAASIGVGVTVFLYLFFDLGAEWKWASIRDQLPKFLYWMVSYICLLVTFDSAMFATLFMVHIPKKAESFWTFLLVGLETLQFSFLVPAIIGRGEVKTIMGVEVFGWWYAVFFFYCLSMFMLVYHAKAEILESMGVFDESLRPMVNHYLRAFKGALLFITAAGCVALGVFFLHVGYQGLAPTQYWIELSTSICFLSFIWIFFLFQHRQRDEIEKLLMTLPSLRSPSTMN